MRTEPNTTPRLSTSDLSAVELRDLIWCLEFTRRESAGYWGRDQQALLNRLCAAHAEAVRD